MRVLIVGGTKYFGKLIVRRLLARGDQVTLFTRGKTRPDREVHGASQPDLKAEEGGRGAGKEDRPGEALMEQGLRHGG